MFLQDLTVDQLSHELVSKLDITPRGEQGGVPGIKRKMKRFSGSIINGYSLKTAKLLGNIDRYNEDEIKD